MHTNVAATCSSSPDDMPAFGNMFGPGHVDQVIRQAIQMCWMSLPKDKRNVEEVERQIRRLVDRALANMREDGEVFKPTTLTAELLQSTIDDSAKTTAGQ